MANGVVRHSLSSVSRWFFVGVLLLALVPAGRLVAQEDAPTNLQVLPKDMTRREVSAVMRGFTGALGVRCSTCHVGEEGLPMSTYDFASDDKPMKLKARAMLKMVTAINGDFLANLPDRHEPNVSVTCNTCHRGVERPVPIESIVEETLASDGLDAAVQQYRELRERYYGSAAYDFSDRPLIVLAQGTARQNPDAAMRLLDLNAEFNPESAGTYTAMGSIAEQGGDNAKAIESYKKALELQPGNRRAEARLKALTGGE